MIMATVYLCLSVVGVLCTLYLTGRVSYTALRTGRALAAAGRVYDRAENPFAFHGILVAWTLITAIMIVCAVASFEIWIEKLPTWIK